MSDKPKSPFSPSELPLVAHLVELRDRLLRAILAVLVIFLALISFANDLYTLLAEPLMAHLPENNSMIATEVASPFLTPFKLTLVLSIFLSMPFLLYQLWSFIAPGLYRHERRMMMPLLISSTALFYGGAAFAYFVVFPVVFGFFTSVAPTGVAVMTDISKYLDFVLKMFFAFGLAFEVPIATIALVWMGVTTPQALAAKRPYIIVAAFVMGMLLTPPDVISQSLLAVPMILLFELGLFFSKMIKRHADEQDEEDSASQQAESKNTAASESGQDDNFDMDSAFEQAQQDEQQLDQPDEPAANGSPPDKS